MYIQEVNYKNNYKSESLRVDAGIEPLAITEVFINGLNEMSQVFFLENSSIDEIHGLVEQAYRDNKIKHDNKIFEVVKAIGPHPSYWGELGIYQAFVGEAKELVDEIIEQISGHLLNLNNKQIEEFWSLAEEKIHELMNEFKDKHNLWSMREVTGYIKEQIQKEIIGN